MKFVKIHFFHIEEKTRTRTRTRTTKRALKKKKKMVREDLSTWR